MVFAHDAHGKIFNKTMNRHENPVLKKKLDYKCDRYNRTFTFSLNYSHHKRIIHGVHAKISSKTIGMEKNMWHEARKQEKKIRCMLVDYQRRAQRRKDYYDKIKADPTQFLQLHGRPCKIHLDPAICIAANSSVTMMPWQGNADVMIDRFDVRAHLDMIPEIQSSNKVHGDLSYEERQINYERYRILVQNDFFSIPEDKFLHQINLEEKFGPLLKNVEQEQSKKRTTVAIGYNYDDDNSNSNSFIRIEDGSRKEFGAVNDEDNDEDSESDIDLDLTVDVSKIETQQANELNTCAHAYGMITNDFFSFLNNDLEEAENMRMVKEQEEEKAMFSGRKSRKERRAFRERTLVGRKLSPPSYAWRKSPSYEDYRALVSSNRSRSKSVSPVNSGKITYITSFGGDEPTTTGTTEKPSTSLNFGIDKDFRKRNRSRSFSRERDRIQRLRRSRSSSVERKKRFTTIKSYSKSRSRSRSKSRNLRSTKDFKNDKKSRSRSPSKTQCPLKTSPKVGIDNSGPSGSGFGSAPLGGTETTVIPRYYGRRKEESSSELSLSSDDESSKQSQASKIKINQASGPSRLNTSIKANNSDKLTPQERLKRKRQVLLNKQFKADKRAEREKVLKMVQERLDRAEEMKEISIKLRRRQRMLRHNDSPKRNSRSASRSRSSSNEWRSSSRSPYRRKSHRRGERYRTPSEEGSEDSCKNDRKRSRRRRNSYSRSRSRTRSRGRSRSRSRSRRSRYSEDRDRRQDDRFKNIKECDKVSRNRRYCTLSEERELARVQLEGKNDDRKERRRDRSPKRKDNYDENNDRKDKSWDRYRDDRSRYSRRSNSHDRYSNRHNY